MRSSPALPLLGLSLAACTAGTKDALDTGFDTATVNGFIFKGPVRAGGAVTVTPLTDALEEAGAPVEVSVLSDDGEYEAELAWRGLVRVEATGTALDEARGEDGSESLTLLSYAVLSEDSAALHVNVITDLVSARVEALIAGGLAPEDAIASAEGELAAALPVGGGEGPGEGGAELDPYGERYAQSWLFAASAVLAQAGRDQEMSGTGTLGSVLADLRADLADDGAFSEDGREALVRAEEHLDPDLATLGLAYALEQAGTGRSLPDPHPALDSDQDGVRNADDNCRYVSNADQAEDLGLGFGDACDYRLASISTSDAWGCGALASDGALWCWEVAGEPTGGVPPQPDVYPSHRGAPWAEGAALSGAYDQITVGEGVFCAISATGALSCWVESSGEELALEGSYTQVALGDALICALGEDGALSCWELSGELAVSEAGPYTDVDVFGDGGLCAIDASGDLSWIEHEGEPYDLPDLPDGVIAEVDASTGGVGCAIDTDGALSCFGAGWLEGALPERAVEVAVGSGVACASDETGTYTCVRDESLCPAPAEDGPGALWGLTAGGCQVCGVDEAGVGHCWPRLWEQDHP